MDQRRSSTREHYAAGLAIAERLAAADPINTGWQRDLSLSRERLGDLAAAAGDAAAAREHYAAGLAIAERLAAAWPDAFLPGLAQVFTRFGVYLTEVGRHDEALAADRRAVTLYLRLQKKDPERFDQATQNALTNLVIDLRNLGRSEEQAQQELEQLIADESA